MEVFFVGDRLCDSSFGDFIGLFRCVFGVYDFLNKFLFLYSRCGMIFWIVFIFLNLEMFCGGLGVLVVFFIGSLGICDF